MHKSLNEVREWAKDKIASGQEPPWAWYQYMKLIEALDAILKGSDCVNPRESSRQSVRHPETPLRLVGATHLPDNAQHHPGAVEVRLPM